MTNLGTRGTFLDNNANSTSTPPRLFLFPLIQLLRDSSPFEAIDPLLIEFVPRSWYSTIRDVRSIKVSTFFKKKKKPFSRIRPQYLEQHFSRRQLNIVSHAISTDEHASSRPNPPLRFVRLLGYTHVWSSVIYRPDTCRRPTSQKQRASSSSLVGTWRKKRKKKKKKKSRISVNVNRRHSFISSPNYRGVIVPSRNHSPLRSSTDSCLFWSTLSKVAFRFFHFLTRMDGNRNNEIIERDPQLRPLHHFETRRYGGLWSCYASY